MKHYIILDKNNKPYGGRLCQWIYDKYIPNLIIDINSTYESLYLLDTINDSLLSFNKDEHKIFEAEIVSCTLPGGNGRNCDGVKFIREVNPDEISSMNCADDRRFPIELDENGNIISPVFYQEIGMTIFNPRAISKLTFME